MAKTTTTLKSSQRAKRADSSKLLDIYPTALIVASAPTPLFALERVSCSYHGTLFAISNFNWNTSKTAGLLSLDSLLAPRKKMFILPVAPFSSRFRTYD